MLCCIVVNSTGFFFIPKNLYWRSNSAFFISWLLAGYSLTFNFFICKMWIFHYILEESKSFVSSVQSLSHVQLFAAPWTAACHASLSITNTWSLLKLMFIESLMPSISSSAGPFSSRLQKTQHQGLFKWVSSSHQVVKVLEFQPQHWSFQWILRVDFL